MTTGICNPFTPAFGTIPLFMAGRDPLIASMRSAFETGARDPNLSTILIGARGTGKTALLSRISDEAKQAGWIVVDVAASKGMLEDIVQRALESASELIPNSGRKRLTGIELAQMIGLQWETEAPSPANWRTKMNAIFNQLAQTDTGLLITVDEVKSTYDEMIRLASTYQLFVRENRKVALLMAGLPKHVSALVSNDDVSFLRRARQHYLGKIRSAEVEIAFEKTVAAGGKSIERAALKEAVAAIDGFPYMMQLVGYYAWMAGTEADVIDGAHVERGIEFARSDLEKGVLEATYRELSAGDRAFLNAMLSCGGELHLSDYASSYKSRLTGQGIVEELPGGGLEVSLPFFRDYLIRQA